jgi:hypothetical protein
MSGGRKALYRAVIVNPCAWKEDPSRLSGGWCDVCRSPGRYDAEGHKCEGFHSETEPMPKQSLERLIFNHTKLNPNLRDDQELVGYIVNAMRALEKAHGIE